jgi:hypothetical protein
MVHLEVMLCTCLNVYQSLLSNYGCLSLQKALSTSSLLLYTLYISNFERYHYSSSTLRHSIIISRHVVSHSSSRNRLQLRRISFQPAAHPCSNPKAKPVTYVKCRTHVHGCLESCANPGGVMFASSYPVLGMVFTFFFSVLSRKRRRCPHNYVRYHNFQPATFGDCLSKWQIRLHGMTANLYTVITAF